MDIDLTDKPNPVKADRAQMKLFKDDLNSAELRGLYRDIFKLAAPVFIGQGFNSLVGFGSRVIISELGEQAYNSVNIGMMVFFVIVTVVAAIGVGTTSLVAQYWGKGDKNAAGKVLQQSLIFGFVLSMGIMIWGLAFHKLLFSWIGVDAETAKMGSDFLFWMFLGVPLLTPGFFFASALRGAGDTMTPMIAGIIMGALSVFFGLGLILGMFGMPRLETIGAALAIDIAFLIFTLLMASQFIGNKTILKLPRDGWRPDNKIGASILKIGAPSAAEWILIQLGILIYVAVITDYGPEVLAGFFTGVAILTFAQTAAFGFQTAATTLVGQSLGSGDIRKAESVFRRTSMLGFVSMGAIGILLVWTMTPEALGFLFSKLSPESIEYSRLYLVILVFVMPLMGISFSMGGGLRGAGDTVWPLIGSTVGVYLGRVLMAGLVYWLFKPPVFIVWCSMFPDLVLRIIVMSYRLKSGKWKTVKV